MVLFPRVFLLISLLPFKTNPWIALTPRRSRKSIKRVSIYRFTLTFLPQLSPRGFYLSELVRFCFFTTISWYFLTIHILLHESSLRLFFVIPLNVLLRLSINRPQTLSSLKFHHFVQINPPLFSLSQNTNKIFVNVSQIGGFIFLHKEKVSILYSQDLLYISVPHLFLWKVGMKKKNNKKRWGLFSLSTLVEPHQRCLSVYGVDRSQTWRSWWQVETNGTNTG